jgi:hypothetical protein
VKVVRSWLCEPGCTWKPNDPAVAGQVSQAEAHVEETGHLMLLAVEVED